MSIEIVRGEPRVEGFIRDPEIDSPYESDEVIRNRQNYPISVSLGGDSTLIEELRNPETGMIDPGIPGPTDAVDQLADVELGILMVQSLRNNPDISTEWRWELRSLDNTVNGLKESILDGIEGNLPKPEQSSEISTPITRTDGSTVRSAVGGSVQPFASTYTHWTTIRSGSCCWSWGQHSAVWFKSFEGATFVYQLILSNHGRKANDSSLSNSSGCPKSWGPRSNITLNFVPYYATDTFGTGDAGGCSTSYGITSGTHVCNDDSFAEYRNIKNNGVSSWVTCSDSTLRTTAPACD